VGNEKRNALFSLSNGTRLGRRKTKDLVKKKIVWEQLMKRFEKKRKKKKLRKKKNEEPKRKMI